MARAAGPEFDRESRRRKSKPLKMPISTASGLRGLERDAIRRAYELALEARSRFDSWLLSSNSVPAQEPTYLVA